MQLSKLATLVTSLKTSATKLGIDHTKAQVDIYSEAGSVSRIQMRGTGREGYIELDIEIN